MSSQLKKGRNWRNLKYEKRAKIKSYVAEYKSKTPCNDCGNIFHPAVMEFDHIGDDKKFNISRCKNTWKATIAEMAKCELVCANCHRMRTINRRGNRVTKYLEPDHQMSLDF
jgi:hypothetical protein